MSPSSYFFKLVRSISKTQPNLSSDTFPANDDNSLETGRRSTVHRRRATIRVPSHRHLTAAKGTVCGGDAMNTGGERMMR
ncbi:hypothetical protein A2U01_0034090, partial [Trifolium medium]|nr:hypothetical protein [Trifolium medium]